MNYLRTWIEIDSRALRRNAAVFRKLIGPKVKLMAVVKSNAYGHGLTQVAKLLARYPLSAIRYSLWFGVDSIVEALRLRREGIRNPILVLGYTLPSRYAEAAVKNITLTISHFDGLAALARVKRRPAFHIKIDSGMHRQGFQKYEMPELIAAMKKFRLKPQGIYSHFAVAENRIFSQKQIPGFERCIRALQDVGIRPGLRHIAATGGALYYPQARYDMVRIGLGLYGYLPLSKSQITNLSRAESRDHKLQITLRPVMAWKTIVGEVKRVRKGEGIGYDLTERLKRDSVVAILPVGYWHGFDRGLSGIGEVLIHPVRSKTPAASAVPPLAERTSNGVHGKRAKVLGRVSMDMTAVDVTGIKNVSIGDDAVLIGRQGREFIGADEMADKIGTTAYETLTRINPLIKRVVK